MSVIHVCAIIENKWSQIALLIVPKEQPCTSDVPPVCVQATPEVSSVGSHVHQAMPDTSSAGIQVSPDANSVQGSEAMSIAILTSVRGDTIISENCVMSYVYMSINKSRYLLSTLAI